MSVDYKLHPILFVDDEPQNQVVFRYAMDDHFTILTASSGLEALEILEREPIAVLLADQRMPAMGGADLCARAREIRPEAVRIIITAYADLHAAIEAINKGQVSRYLIKPWRNEELIEILQTSIEFVHLQQAMSEMELRLLRGGQKRIATAVHDELLHEIANPLGAMTMTLLQASEMIDGVIACLAQGGASSLPAIKADLLELREAHGDAMAAVEQLNALAARMRALPSPAQAPANSDAGRVVDATVRIIRRDIERVATLHVVLERSPLVRVEASELGQIVLNLILNAAQAIEGSGMQGRAIRLSVDARADMAVVSVTDDGPGIDAENLGRIFEPYFTTKSTGSGIGLSIVREMVRRAGGRISAHSVPRQETRFEVLLPLAEASARDES
jgi:two-component system NtrC family sensor kinase